ncbi:MAG: outer membrane lipoprotein carrier protein LolA [Rhodospirillaceae bacterium]|nr:outer membrane lipoprotein carrier protein LolA [Rhodospirillaceae bacterium]
MTLPRAIPGLAGAGRAALLLAAGAGAQTPDPGPLSARDRADLKRIEAKVNSFRTLRTRFRQISPNGRIDRGDIFIQRPGQMRIQFDRRDLVLLTSRLWLIVIQGKHGEPQHFPLNSTPAGILVRSEIRFDRDIRVIRVHRTAGEILVTVVRRESSRQGRMTLAFDRDTLDLSGWTVLDAQGELTQVFLSETQLDVALDPLLFALPAGRLPAPPGSDR